MFTTATRENIFNPIRQIQVGYQTDVTRARAHRSEMSQLCFILSSRNSHF